MERSLDPLLLATALGGHVRLPSPGELSTLIADAEINLLLKKPSISDELITVAWYLHGVAAARPASELYGVDRQRAAFQVAAHVFDLLLQKPDLSETERLELAFAAEIAYLRSSFDPNTLATYRNSVEGRVSPLEFPVDSARTAFALGAAVLAIDASFLFSTTKLLDYQIRRLEIEWEVESFHRTAFGSAALLVRAVRDLTVFLIYGRETRCHALP